MNGKITEPSINMLDVVFTMSISPDTENLEVKMFGKSLSLKGCTKDYK